uniref:Uncharacterized protein n=1 Tax=Glossina palpalis gambiensis TaxID=67801 RepID=A0A1B0BT33_9MUSC
MIKKHMLRGIPVVDLSCISIFKCKMAQHGEISSFKILLPRFCFDRLVDKQFWPKRLCQRPMDSMVALGDFPLPHVTWSFNEDLALYNIGFTDEKSLGRTKLSGLKYWYA